MLLQWFSVSRFNKYSLLQHYIYLQFHNARCCLVRKKAISPNNYLQPRWKQLQCSFQWQKQYLINSLSLMALFTCNRFWSVFLESICSTFDFFPFESCALVVSAIFMSYTLTDTPLTPHYSRNASRPKIVLVSTTETFRYKISVKLLWSKSTYNNTTS